MLGSAGARREARGASSRDPVHDRHSRSDRAYYIEEFRKPSNHRRLTLELHINHDDAKFNSINLLNDNTVSLNENS